MARAWVAIAVVLVARLAQASETKLASVFDNLCDESCNVCEDESSSWEQLIVRMQKYNMHNVVESKIRVALSPISSKSWDWIPRTNAAMRFPTDFGVIRVDSTAREEILSLFSVFNDVKDVHSDCQIGQRQLLRKEEEEDVEVPPIRGRRLTRWSFEEYEDQEYNVTGSRRDLKSQHVQRSITGLFNAEELWNKGIYGQNMKVAVFDTGVREDHPHFRKIKERTNWTHEDFLDDGVGHGTLVAGVIASQDQQCAGFAPEAEIHAFRVFTNDQVSYTSWFLDAFNYAIATNMDVLNLSIGGPDYLDAPFVEKVWEVTANGIVMVSAIGNDGPLYGTLNNPADQADVIGVGGIDYSEKIAGFSSRGITTWELPHGIGRIKPDIVAYGKDVMGSKIEGGCSRLRTLSGTSVASPVVAGAVTLICSSLPPKTVNPAMVKQALIESAQRLVDVRQTEQGSGRLDLLEAQRALIELSKKPRASVQPQVLDMTKQNCPYAWPYCAQPLYAGSMPTVVNLTLLNSMGVTGQIFQESDFKPDDDASSGLIIQVTHSDVVWPWSGYLGLYISVNSSYSQYSGTMSGTLSLGIESPPGHNEELPRRSTVTLPIKVDVVPTPPREKRILWDIFHSVRYPPAYIPRDSLDVQSDILDWHGDHPFTNFHVAFEHLIDEGYFVETLSMPFTCFDASKYAALLLVDSEEEYSEPEIQKLKNDVEEKGLGVFVAADWYNVETMVKMRFFDDNTRSWWTPLTGGANVPALNDLLEPFGVSLSESVLNGNIKLGSNAATFASGTSIARFPAGGVVHRAKLLERSQPSSLLKTQSNAKLGTHSRIGQNRGQSVEYPVLGLLDKGAGKLAVYGDSNCLDASHIQTSCFWLLSEILSWMTKGQKTQTLFSVPPLGAPLIPEGAGSSPHRRDDKDFRDYVASVLQSVSVPGQGARINYRAGLLKPDRDFCGNDFTMDTVGGKSLSSDVTYLESLNFVSVDKLYVAPIVESNQVFQYVEVPGKAYNQTQSDPELNVSFDSSVPKEDTADNPTVIDDINKTGPNGRDDIEEAPNIFEQLEFETSFGLVVPPALAVLGGISLLLMWKTLRTSARRGPAPRLLDV